MTMTDLPDVAIHIERCRAEASLPFYAHPGDAGMDLRAAVNCVIEPGQTVAVPTGLRLAIPAGFEIQIRPRSGLSLHTPLRVPNSPGTIDSGFRDEVCVLLSNSGPSGSESAGEPWTLDTKGNKPGAYRVRVGDRIAQMVLARVETIRWEETSSVREVGNDRGGGFGHSGIR